MKDSLFNFENTPKYEYEFITSKNRVFRVFGFNLGDALDKFRKWRYKNKLQHSVGTITKTRRIS